MSTAELYNKLNQYKQFKANVEEIVRNLQASLSPLTYAISSIGNNYQYDDDSADNRSLSKTKEKVNKTIQSLQSTIIPAINSKIAELERLIADAEMANTLGGVIWR